MNISSLVVRAARGRRDDVRARLARMPGVSIEGETAAGQFVVVADHDDAADAAEAYVAINQIEGVLSVSLVYQFSEENQPEGIRP
jgi:nitrate reductase NapAB chaperone NapD